MSSDSNPGAPPSKVPPRRALGSLRPSQLIYSHGVGSIVDLPNISAMMMGLDDWQQPRCQVVSEERLLAAVQDELGPQVVRLLSPMPSEDVGSFRPSFDAPVIGVPVAPFPRYLRCPICGFLGPLSCGLFKFKPDSFRPDRTRYVHENCAKGNAPTALPARFLLACERGHLDDFPWDHFVHRGNTGCRTRLELFEGWRLGRGRRRDREMHHLQRVAAHVRRVRRRGRGQPPGLPWSSPPPARLRDGGLQGHASRDPPGRVEQLVRRHALGALAADLQRPAASARRGALGRSSGTRSLPRCSSTSETATSSAP